MARSAIIGSRPPALAPASAKLALVELVLASPDPAECAQQALDWLHEHAEIQQAICAALDGASRRLVGLGGFGIAHGRLHDFSLDVEERAHPHVAQTHTAIPLKLFTILASDARACAHLGEMRRELGAAAARLAGRAEWGLRVSFDGGRAPAARPARNGRSSFLQQKKEQRDAVRALLVSAREEAERIFDALSESAADANRRELPADAGRLLLDAAFLVPSRRATRFRRTVTTLQHRLGPRGYELVLTGRWPAYHFVGEGRDG